jgi:hypothetical protein
LDYRILEESAASAVEVVKGVLSRSVDYCFVEGRVRAHSEAGVVADHTGYP